MSVEIETVDSIEGFKALKDDWNDLYSQIQEATIFLSWDWMITWWEVYCKSINSRLFILCVYQDNELIGIAPFHLLNSFPKSLIQGRTITFIGSGESCKDKIVSQYSDFLVKNDKKAEMIDSISNYLMTHKDKWDFADFGFLLNDSAISNCFANNTSGIHINLNQYGNRFFISDIENFDDFLNKMGNRWSKMYKKKDRKLENHGNVEIDCPESIESVQMAFEQLAKMHGERWKGRAEFNIFKSTLFNEFHKKILKRFVPQDRAFVRTLLLDGQPLSSYFCFKDKSQIHYYQSGFYSENANKYSPLFLLVCKEIGIAIKEDYLFDFMFDEDSLSYKKEQYAAQSEPMYRLMWSHRKARMDGHILAKKFQMKYLNFKKSLRLTKNK